MDWESPEMYTWVDKEYAQIAEKLHGANLKGLPLDEIDWYSYSKAIIVAAYHLAKAEAEAKRMEDEWSSPPLYQQLGRHW